jgi:hypothetical protein
MMRDIVQVSIGILNPYAGTIAKGSTIQPVEPVEPENDINYIQEGVLVATGLFLLDSPLWSL